jgi:penicillin-binding protein 1C
MDRMSGAIGAGPLFHKIAKLVVHREALPKVPARAKPPEGVEQIEVCALSGMTPTEHCPHRHWVYVLKEDTPRPPCDMHRKLRIDKRNGLLASDRCPSGFVEEKVFEVLPSLYAEWQADHDSPHPPTRYSPYCPEKGIIPNALIITSPREGDVYLIEPGYDRSTQTLQLNGEVDPALPEITWLVDGEKVAAAAWPYEAIWPMNKGTHRLEMIGGGMRSDPIEFEIR